MSAVDADTLPAISWGTVDWIAYEVDGRLGIHKDRARATDATTGRTYEKYFWKNSGGKWDRFWTAADDAGEAVRCDCGSVWFTLSFGEYELRGTCIDCGAEETVYSG